MPGSSVHGIFQARILEWVAISFSRWSSRPRDRTHTSCTASGFFSICATWEALHTLLLPCLAPDSLLLESQRKTESLLGSWECMGDDFYQKERYSTCQGVLKQSFFLLKQIDISTKALLYFLCSLGSVMPTKHVNDYNGYKLSYADHNISMFSMSASPLLPSSRLISTTFLDSIYIYVNILY